MTDKFQSPSEKSQHDPLVSSWKQVAQNTIGTAAVGGGVGAVIMASRVYIDLLHLKFVVPQGAVESVIAGAGAGTSVGAVFGLAAGVIFAVQSKAEQNKTTHIPVDANSKITLE